MSYKARIEQDLDRWIASGLVPADSRAAILASIPDARRLDAATALAWVGGVLMGIAVIAFVAANWDGMSRLARFGIVLAAFLALAAGGAWAAQRQRPILADILLTVTVLVFAASIGLVGQIFDIVGEPRAAFHGAGLAGLALGLAGRSTGSACVGLVFVALGDFAGLDGPGGMPAHAPWLVLAAPLGAFLALRWVSTPLAHVSALAIVACAAWFAARLDPPQAGVLFVLSIALAAMAALARWFGMRQQPVAGVFYGWLAAGAIVFFAVSGYLPLPGDESGQTAGVAHRIVWLAASGALVALGRIDRHPFVTAVGVLGLIGAVSALLMDLGLDLMTAAGVFLLCAVAALVAGLLLRRSRA